MGICTCTINKNLALGIMLVCAASPQWAPQRNIELTALPCLPCSQYCSVVPQRGHGHSKLAQVAALNRSADISGMLAPPQPGRSWRGIWTVCVAASPRCCAHAHRPALFWSPVRAAVCSPSRLQHLSRTDVKVNSKHQMYCFPATLWMIRDVLLPSSTPE